MTEVFSLGYSYFREFAKTSYGCVKLEKEMLFRDKHRVTGPYLGSAKGDPDIRTFDLGALFLSLSLALSHTILLC
jgi:hypothetical protein